MLKQQIASCEQQLSSLRSDNIQLESSSRLEVTTQTIQSYSEEEIRKIESDIYSLKGKNQKLRGVLQSMGLKTLSVTTGKVTTEEIHQVSHEQQRTYHPIVESMVDKERVLSRH